MDGACWRLNGAWRSSMSLGFMRPPSNASRLAETVKRERATQLMNASRIAPSPYAVRRSKTSLHGFSLRPAGIDARADRGTAGRLADETFDRAF
jgi:hypothetical protein